MTTPPSSSAAFGDGIPELDWLLLGLGPDAHTASLFPAEPRSVERERGVVGRGDARAWRHSSRASRLTLPVMNAAREVIFLVTGEDKAEAVARAFGGLRPGPEAPASLVRPTQGTLTVVLDGAAAQHLRTP